MTNLSNIAGFQAPAASVGVLLGTTTNNYSHTVSTGASAPEGSTSYSGFFAAAAPTATNLRTRDTFAHWTQWRSPNSGASGFTVSSFVINRSTGQITTVSANQNVWYNSGGSANSTTYLIYDPTHGCFFSGGHNAYPGYSSHVFGYTAGRLAADGTISNSSTSYTNRDHGFNGSYCGCLPSASGGTNYFLTGGYNSSSGSVAGSRVISCSASGPSIGGFSNHGNWTSSSNGCHHIFQPDHQGYSSGEMISITATSFNSPEYGYRYIPSGSTGGNDIKPFGSTYVAELLGANGGNTCAHNTNGNFWYSSGSNIYNLVDGYPDFGNQYTKGKTVGVGDDSFLYLGDSDEGYAIFFRMDNSTRQPIKVTRVPISVSGEKSFLPTVGNLQYFVVYENDTDTHPKWLVSCKKETGMSFSIQSQEIIVDFNALKA